MSSSSKLTDYQKAILTEMDVIPWELRTRPDSKQANHPPQLDSEAPEVGIQDGVNIHITAQSHPLITDILRCLGIDNQRIHFSANEQYAFEWLVGENISFSQEKLVTPKLEDLISPDVKRAVWRVLWRKLQQTDV